MNNYHYPHQENILPNDYPVPPFAVLHFTPPSFTPHGFNVNVPPPF